MDNWFINNETGRIEFQDARFYKDSRTGQMVPSVTTLLEAWPKGAAYYEWLKKHGSDSDSIRDEAGRRGSVVHNLTEQLDFGAEVRMCNDDGSPRYKMGEWAMLERYVEFRKAHTPRIINIETNLIDSELGFAGTLDRVVELKGDIWILDIKTSAAIYDHFELQLIAYWQLYCTLNKIPHDTSLKFRLGILWLNAKTKTEGKGAAVQGKGWQLVEVIAPKDHLLKLWDACRTMWHAVNQGVKPKAISYALSHKIEQPQEQPTTTNNNSTTWD